MAVRPAGTLIEVLIKFIDNIIIQAVQDGLISSQGSLADVVRSATYPNANSGVILDYQGDKYNIQVTNLLKTAPIAVYTIESTNTGLQSEDFSRLFGVRETILAPNQTKTILGVLQDNTDNTSGQGTDTAIIYMIKNALFSPYQNVLRTGGRMLSMPKKVPTGPLNYAILQPSIVMAVIGNRASITVVNPNPIAMVGNLTVTWQFSPQITTQVNVPASGFVQLLFENVLTQQQTVTAQATLTNTYMSVSAPVTSSTITVPGRKSTGGLA